MSTELAIAENWIPQAVPHHAEARFNSLVAVHMDDLKRYATQGKEGKQGRVYLTAVSGMSKAGKPYNMIKVYDPNQQKTTAPTPSSDLPF